MRSHTQLAGLAGAILSTVLGGVLLAGCYGVDRDPHGLPIPAAAPLDFVPKNFTYQGGSTTFTPGATAMISVDVYNGSSSSITDFTLEIREGIRPLVSTSYDLASKGPL